MRSNIFLKKVRTIMKWKLITTDISTTSQWNCSYPNFLNCVLDYVMQMMFTYMYILFFVHFIDDGFE